MQRNAQHTRAWIANLLTRICRQLVRVGHGTKYFVLTLLWSNEYHSSAAEGGESHLSEISKKYFSRARCYSTVSMLLLVATAFLIFYGVRVFLRPLEYADVPEAESQSKIESLERTIESLLEEEERPKGLYRAETSYHSSLAPIFEVYASLNGAENREALVLGKPLRDLDRLLDAIRVDKTSHLVNRDLYKSYRNATGAEETTIDGATLKRLANTVESQGSVDSMVQAVDEVMKVEGGDEVGQEKIRPAVREFREAFSWVTQEWKSAESRIEEARKELNEAEAESLERRQRIQEINREISRAIANETVHQQTWGFMQVFIPLLTLRLAVAILVLFLTRILLESYRYTMGLAAFYRARGDALQMIGRGDAGMPVDPDALKKVVDVLSAEKHRIEPVEGAEGYLVSLLPGRGKPKSVESHKERRPAEKRPDVD